MRVCQGAKVSELWEERWKFKDCSHHKCFENTAGTLKVVMGVTGCQWEPEVHCCPSRPQTTKSCLVKC